MKHIFMHKRKIFRCAARNTDRVVIPLMWCP